MLKAIDAKNKEKGLAIIGVSLDDDAKKVQAAIESRGINWPQIRDGKSGQISKLFNAKGTPTYYVLDRRGRIAAKNPPAEKLAGTIAGLMQRPAQADSIDIGSRSGPNSTASGSDRSSTVSGSDRSSTVSGSDRSSTVSGSDRVPIKQPQAGPVSTRFATVESASRDQWQKPAEVIKALDIKPGQVVVDLGAGSGYFTRRFAEAVGPEGRAVGLEIEASLVRTLAADAKRWNLGNYEARLVPADDPMLSPHSVDMIFVCDTYHEIDNRIPYFTKAAEALGPTGRLVIIDFVRTPENPKHSIVREEVIKELREAGYRLVKEDDLLLPKQYFLQFAIGPAER